MSTMPPKFSFGFTKKNEKKDYSKTAVNSGQSELHEDENIITESIESFDGDIVK